MIRTPRVTSIKPVTSATIAAVAFAAAMLAPVGARADERSIIRAPGDHTPYFFEAEPHLLLGFAGPFEEGDNFGIGFRGTFHITDGFVKSINDSIGIGLGFDVGTHSRVLVPVVMQWNFWLSTHWSVFGEPGIAVGSGRDTQAWPVLYVGGRFLFTDRIALTMRLGFPDASVGVSFLL
jgi:hypothetical protein